MIHKKYAILIIGILVGLLGCNRAEEERRKAEADAVAAEARKYEEEKKKAEAMAKEREAKIDALLAQLAQAKDEATREAIQKQLEALRPQKPDGKTPSPQNSAKPCNCITGDPLCSCL